VSLKCTVASVSWVDSGLLPSVLGANSLTSSAGLPEWGAISGRGANCNAGDQ
jgi:hypothetical protein